MLEKKDKVEAVRRHIRQYALMTLGTFVMAVGVYFFKFPNHFGFGGVTGLAVPLGRLLPISASLLSSIMNVALLVLGIFLLGRNFVIRTAYSSLLLSLLLAVFEWVYPMKAPFTAQPLLELGFAIVLPALGSAILFNIEASSGGTDVIAMILKKYTSIDIGMALFISDILIVILSGLVFGMTTFLFSAVGLVMKSFMVDNFIESINLCKYFTVIAEDPEHITDFITKTLKRSATVIKGQGAYSKKDKYVILTVLNRFQAVRLKNYIKATDPGAFLLISNTSEIIGKGFHSI